jgi:hypothetical protein
LLRPASNSQNTDWFYPCEFVVFLGARDKSVSGFGCQVSGPWRLASSGRIEASGQNADTRTLTPETLDIVLFKDLN